LTTLPALCAGQSSNYTCRTWVFGFDRTPLDADASVGNASCSGATAARFRLVLHVNLCPPKTENPCAAGTQIQSTNHCIVISAS